MDRDIDSWTPVQASIQLESLFLCDNDSGDFGSLIGGRWGIGQFQSPALLTATSELEDCCCCSDRSWFPVPSASSVNIDMHGVHHLAKTFDDERVGVSEVCVAAWDRCSEKKLMSLIDE